MDTFHGGDLQPRTTFFNHVFSTTDEGKAELLNVVQYALLGIVPVLLLNKLVHYLIPEADDRKSTIEIMVEIVMQIVIMFSGIILIHRVISYIPTYSEFKYDALSFTSVILAFFVIMLSIQTKLGIKTNILYDRIMELWNGPTESKVRHRRKDGNEPNPSGYLTNPATDASPSILRTAAVAERREPLPAGGGGAWGAW